MSSKISKAGALYIHAPKGNVKCEACWKYIPDQERCAEMGIADIIKPFGSCNLFSPGTPRKGLTPSGQYNPLKAGYEESKEGFNCKRCGYYGQQFQRCKIVNHDSPGDDPERIDPDGCCSNWEHK